MSTLPCTCSELRGLILRPGALGDVLIALPSIQRLRSCLPDVRLCWVGYPSHLDWLQKLSLLEEYRSIDESLFLSLFEKEISKQLGTFLASFSFCIAWMNDREGDLSRSLGRFFQNRLLCSPPFPAAGSGIHAADHLWAGLRDWSFLQGKFPPDLPEKADLFFHPRKDSRQRKSTSGIIHPGSGGRKKCWPLKRFQEVSLGLAAKGHPITWLLGYAEEDMEEETRFFCLDHGMELLLYSPLESVIDRFLEAGWYLGNDSGISHLAAFCGLVTFVLFGPTSPAEWGPRGNHTHIFRKPTQPAPWIDPETVLDRMASSLESTARHQSNSHPLFPDN